MYLGQLSPCGYIKNALHPNICSYILSVYPPRHPQENCITAHVLIVIECMLCCLHSEGQCPLSTAISMMLHWSSHQLEQCARTECFAGPWHLFYSQDIYVVDHIVSLVRAHPEIMMVVCRHLWIPRGMQSESGRMEPCSIRALSCGFMHNSSIYLSLLQSSDDL